MNDLCENVYVDSGQHAFLPELVFRVSFIQFLKGGLSDNEVLNKDDKEINEDKQKRDFELSENAQKNSFANRTKTRRNEKGFVEFLEDKDSNKKNINRLTEVKPDHDNYYLFFEYIF